MVRSVKHMVHIQGKSTWRLMELHADKSLTSKTSSLGRCLSISRYTRHIKVVQDLYHKISSASVVKMNHFTKYRYPVSSTHESDMFTPLSRYIQIPLSCSPASVCFNLKPGPFKISEWSVIQPIRAEIANYQQGSCGYAVGGGRFMCGGWPIKPQMSWFLSIPHFSALHTLKQHNPET